jgi:predicted RNA polymerase sigma factor
MATLNHAIAVAMTDGPDAGLAMLSAPAADDRMARHHRLTATRAHLLELAGDTAAARWNYLLASRGITSMPERRYLRARAGQLTEVDPTC